MNDLISRQAAIDAINEYCTSAPEYMQGWANKLIEAVKGDIAEIISELSAAHEWFSVDEARKRLVVGSRVLVCVGADKAVMKLQYIGNGRFWAAPGAEYYDCEIKAWMPLPEPPKEEEK